MIDYVSVIKQDDNKNEASWVNGFIVQCENGDHEFDFIYKNLKEELITQFGFEQTNEVILPEIIWSKYFAEFCD